MAPTLRARKEAVAGGSKKRWTGKMLDSRKNFTNVYAR
jgi:hypothetical protein